MNKFLTFMRESSTARFFIPAGLVLIIIGVAIFIINSKNQDFLPVESTVSNVVLAEEAYTDTDGNHVEATYNISLKYSVDGKEYDGSLENVSKYSVGDKIKIYYDPKDPSQITQTKSLIFPIILFALGIISFGYGTISAINAVKRHKKMKDDERKWKDEK